MEEKTVYCEKCGKANKEGVRFCSGCGAPIESARKNVNRSVQIPAGRAVNTAWIKAYEAFLRIEQVAWGILGIILIVIFILFLIQ